MALQWQANALAASGDAAGAIDSLRRCRVANVTRDPVGDFGVDLFEADVRLAGGDVPETDRLLRQAFALGRRERLFNTLQWLPAQMSRLCAFALERGIEPEYINELIRVRGLHPPSPDTVVWPWPLKIRCLGAFEILRDERPLRFEGKAQRKPMALLKALIALGAADVPEDKLIDIVWGEALEGDAQKAFDVTLHRLRKLLDHDKAIQVGDRHVSLNPELVWVDLWALERRLTALLPVGGLGVPEAALEQAAPAILQLARGVFLQGEADAAWLLPVRNRFIGRFQRFVLRLGEQREVQSRWADAAELYERAIELDPLGEVFYARLMLCLREQGRRAEAIEVFRRCRQLLSITLGVQPGEHLQARYCELVRS
jgi:DNA-binding SARP family transcriptional activator